MIAQDDKKNPQRQVPVNYVVTSHGKEAEAASIKAEMMEDVSKETELPKEIKDIGVEKIHGVIELPPDVKKLGVTQSGAQAPVGATSATITLPIPDDKIFLGIQAPVSSSLKWMAAWCLKRLKSVHLMLKKIHGKIVRTAIR